MATSALVAQTAVQSPGFFSEKNTDSSVQFIAPFPITSHPEADVMPALSPEGKWLAYVSRQNKNYDIWVKPAAGGLATALTTNTSDDYSPSWSPEGKAIVFVSRRDDAEGDLYLLKLEPREDGFAPGKLQRLTANFVREAHPAFSPDGKKIAYSVGPAGAEQIWFYEIKNKKSYPLTRRGGTQPAWSPEGKTLAISCPSHEDEGHQIFLISSDTTQADYLRRQVTFEGDNLFPSFSPDGKELLVQRFETAHNNSTHSDFAERPSHLRVIALERATMSLDQPSHDLRLTPGRENTLFPFWGSDSAIYYAAKHYGNFDLWRLPEAGPIPRFASPAAAFANAHAIADPEIALLAFFALRFYFPDSTAWLAAADLEIGRRHLALKDTAEAKDTFEEIAEEYAGPFEAGLFAEYELAKLAGSIQRCEEILKRASSWPAVQAFCQLEIGNILQTANKLEFALRTFQALPQQYTGIKEACYAAWLNSGEILLALDRPEEAEANWVAIDKNYPEQLDWRATAINHLLDSAPRSSVTSDTLASYQFVVQKYAATPAIAYAARFRIAERLAREGENVLAGNEYRSLLDFLQAHDDPYLQNLKAEAALRLIRVQIVGNDFPAATQLYSNFLEAAAHTRESTAGRAAKEELANALVQRGRVLARAQDHDLALALFSQARTFDMRQVEAHRGYVEAMNARGHIEEAAAEYRDLSARNPENEILLYTLGLAYSYQGENDLGMLRRSCAIIERTLALNYRLVPAYLTLSFNYEGIEQLEGKERERKKGLFEKAALALPRLLDNVRRTVTFRPPKAQERWYERALDALTIAIALNDENADPQREAQLALNLANNYYNFGEYGFENAYRYYRLKLQYDSSFTSPKQQQLVCERFGHAGSFLGKTQEAAPFLKQAVELAQIRRDVESELRMLLRLAYLYQNTQDYENAITYFRQFLTASRRENRTENVAAAWRSLAYNHQKLAEADEAVDKGEHSLFLMEQAGAGAFIEPTKNKFRIKLLGLPVFWWTVAPAGEESSAEGLSYAQEKELVFSIIEESWASRKEYDEALQTLEQKAESFRRRKYFTGEAVALNNLGILWYNLHDFQKAGNYFLSSFNLCARHQLHAGKIINLINLGNLALLQQRWGKEAVSFSLSLDSLLQVSRLSLAEVSLQSPRQKLAVCNMLGNLHYYTAQQNWNGAAVEYAGARKGGPQGGFSHFEAAGNGAPRENLQQNIQRTLLALQSLAKARAAYDTALALSQSFRLAREEVMVRRNLASLLMLAGDYASAWEHLTRALDKCLAGNYNELIWRVAHALGNLRGVYQPPAAAAFAQASPWQWYHNALTVLEALPGESEGIEQRISEAEEQRALYDNAVSLLSRMSANNHAADSLACAALALVERSHASRFVNLVATRYILPKKERHRLIWGGNGGEAAEQRRVLSRLRGELRKLEAEETPRVKELARVRVELAQAEKDYQKIVQKALAEDPELASFFSVQPLNVRAIQDQLPEGTAVLQYYCTPEEVLLWRIAAEGVEQFRVPCSQDHLRQLVAGLRAACQTRGPDHQKYAEQLSALLLSPLENLGNYSRLIIIPDESLHYLPFAVLPYRGEPLAAQFLLSRAPSLQALQFAERHKNLNSDNLLIVQDAGATADFSAAQKFAGITVRALRGADWREPAGAARQQVQTAGILHLQHTFVSLPGRPLDSGFVLRMAGSDSTPTAAVMLPLYRLFEFDLSSSLIVLENAAFPFQKDQTGEEMIALPRSLMYAGAPALILNQWQPAPEAREVFYKTFYSCVPQFSLSDAFQAAQLAVRARYPDPADWAGFELIGFSGMPAEEKRKFAESNFIATVNYGLNSEKQNNFGDAVRYFKTAVLMARQLGRDETVPDLYQFIKRSAIAGNDFSTACEIETEILESAGAAKDINQVARSYHNLAVWQLQLKNYARAAEYEREYLALAERAGTPVVIAGSHMQLAEIHKAAAAYDSAMSHAQKAADIFAAHHEALSRLQAEALLGKLAIESDRYTAALDYLENALRSFQNMRAGSSYSPEEQGEVAITRQLLGQVYSRLTAYRQALELHERSLRIFEALADTFNIARAEQFVAETYWLNADYQNALLHQQRALQLAEALNDEDLRIRGQTALGLIWLDLGETERALDLQKQALQKALEWEDRRRNEARRAQATIQINLGKVYLQQQKYQPALASFGQAALLDRQLHARRDLLYCYIYLGQTHHALAQADSALFYAVQAESLAVQLHDPRGLAKALYTEGLAHLQRNNRARARIAWNEALAKSESIQLDEVQWRCLWQLGSLARQENDLESALDFYHRGLAALERLSGKIKVEEFRSGFIDDKAEIYEEAVLLLLQMKREAEAFIMAERAKSRSFADLLANNKVGWQSPADHVLLERREQLLESINFVQSQIATVQTQPLQPDRAQAQMVALADSLHALQRAYSEVLVEIKIANPELADAVSVAPLPLPEVQAMLADSVALVEYFFAKDRLVSWVVERTQIRAVAVPFARNELNESIVQFRKAIQKRASTESFARALYEHLIKPVEPFIQAAKQLVIVPHGALHYLPFPALQKSDNTYLIDSHALALAPSATVLGFCYRKGSSLRSPAPPDYRVLALGNPDVGNPRWDLPFAEKEIKSLEQTFGDITSYTRAQATQSALLAAVGEASLLHFSCHGEYDEHNPLFSALLLAPDSANATGRLEAHKIFSMQLNASLVMLSACETGLARVTGGDEVIGLTRSFIFAGTPSLIASLWTVDDLATAITVKRFYRYFKAGASKAQALRMAQRFVRDHHNRHPAYWASFGLTGDWR